MDTAAIPLAVYEGREKKPKARFARTNTEAIMATVFEPIRWIIPGYVSEGLSILAGRQKLGKTWLAIDWAIAVACGGIAMGSISCEQGDVLYIDMENGPRRIQRRIDALFPDGRNRRDLSRMEWASEAPALNKGFIDALEDWRLSFANPRLVDVLQRIKPARNANQNSYESDYSTMAGLQQWATQHGVAVVALHHTKKGGADDPLEALSGFNGLSACADSTLVLDKDSDGITLYVRGRDVEERESALDFCSGIWTLKGDASKVRMTSERQAILDALLDAGESMSPAEIADATRMSNQNVRQLLVTMVKADAITKVGRGRYVYPDRSDHNATPITTITRSQTTEKAFSRKG